jgi:hypothetical protein
LTSAARLSGFRGAGENFKAAGLPPGSSIRTPPHPHPTSHFSLLTSHFSLLTSHFSLLTPHFSLLTSHFSLLTSHFSLLTSHFPLPTSHFLLLSTLHFLLSRAAGGSPRLRFRTLGAHGVSIASQDPLPAGCRQAAHRALTSPLRSPRSPLSPSIPPGNSSEGDTSIAGGVSRRRPATYHLQPGGRHIRCATVSRRSRMSLKPWTAGGPKLREKERGGK